MLFDDLTCSECEVQRVGTATEIARVPAWVLILGLDNKWKLDEQSSLGLGARESMKNRYDDSPEENSLIGNSAQFENDARLIREPVKRFKKWDGYNGKTEETVWQP